MDQKIAILFALQEVGVIGSTMITVAWTPDVKCNIQRVAASCRAKEAVQPVEANPYGPPPEKINDGIFLVYGQVNPSDFADGWIDLLTNWMSPKNHILLCGPNIQLQAWYNEIPGIQKHLPGKPLRDMKSVWLIGPAKISKVKPLQKEKWIAFSTGGGIGDLIHHYVAGEYTNSIKKLRDAFGSKLKVRVYLYAASKAGLTFFDNCPLVDDVVRTNVPIIDNEEWIPSMGEETVNRFVARHGKKMSDFLSDEPQSLPTGKIAHLSTREKTFYSNSIFLHLFSADEAKLFISPQWWIDLVTKLIEADYNVVILGCPSDRDTCPYMIEFWDWMIKFKSSKLKLMIDDAPFLAKANYLKFAKGAIVIPSSWAHAVEALKVPAIMFQQDAFYQQYMKSMERSDYDRYWHPDVRAKIREYNLIAVSPIEEELFRVFWGFRAGPAPPFNDIFKTLKIVQSIKLKVDE